MWYPDNQLREKLNLCILLQANENIFARIKYVLEIVLEICIRNVSMKNYIYLLRQDGINYWNFNN